MTTLLPFSTQLTNAWKLFLSRWGTAVVLQLFTLIPGIFMYPLVSEYVQANVNGENVNAVFQNSVYVNQFLFGFVLLMLIGIFVASATGVLFAAQKKVSLGALLTNTVKTYIAVLYTSMLSGLAVLFSIIPAMALYYWYVAFARGGSAVTGSAVMAVDAIVLVALVALLIPAAIVATYVMYAPLAVALKVTSAGFTAIMHTKHLVAHHVWQLSWRIVGSIALFQIVSASVSTLPYASFFVPFVLSIVILAFFVELYKELQEA
ncbi:MAG: hypothetical protein O3A36_03970 [bacterium]|nr:hypothetical protein [bacterium]